MSEILYDTLEACPSLLIELPALVTRLHQLYMEKNFPAQFSATATALNSSESSTSAAAMTGVSGDNSSDLPSGDVDASLSRLFSLLGVDPNEQASGAPGATDDDDESPELERQPMTAQEARDDQLRRLINKRSVAPLLPALFSAFRLSVLPPTAENEHKNTECSRCGSKIYGSLYRCTECNVDLCNQCEDNHDPNHALLKIRKPSGPQSPSGRGRHGRRVNRRYEPYMSSSDHSGRRRAAANSRDFSTLPGDHSGAASQQGSQHSSSTPSPSSAPQAAGHSLKIVEDIPLPSAVRPGTRLVKIWSVQNDGSTTWPMPTRLVPVRGHSFGLSESKAPVIEPLPPGGSSLIAVDLLVPHHGGTLISVAEGPENWASGQFSLVAPDGVPFNGTLSASVELDLAAGQVPSPPPAPPLPQPLPPPPITPFSSAVGNNGNNDDDDGSIADMV